MKAAMDQWTKAVGGPIGVALAVISVGGVLYFFARQAGKVAKDAVKAVADVNKGTAYEGAGVVGTLGNVTNQVSGGFFESIGSKIGGALADFADSRRKETAPEAPKFQPRSTTVSEQAKYYDAVLFP